MSESGGGRPTPEEFDQEVHRYLSGRYARRGADERRAKFVWGEGSDEVRVFQEPDRDREADPSRPERDR